MWKACRAVRVWCRPSANSVGREPRIGERGYAIDVPELNSGKGSLLKGERHYTLEKKEGTSRCNSAVAVASEEAGVDAEHGNGEKCEADVRSLAKLCSGIGKLVISKCSFIFDGAKDTFEGNCSLQDVLKHGLWLSPETLRRFWRASQLKPGDFLDILIGFGQGAAEVRNARFLWNLYRWASWQSKHFQHLPRSNDMMVSILADAHMLSQAESLLLLLDDNKALTDASALFSQVIQAYSEAGHLDKSVAIFDRARYICLIPSASCYQLLLNLLLRRRKEELVIRVYLDMLEVGLGSCTQGQILDFVISSLVKRDKFLQAIGIIRQLKSLNIEISKVSLLTVAKEFCKKKDIGDMMNFLEEWRYLPELRLCNRMLASLCKNLGTDEAWFVFQRLEAFGFAPDATTFGIFVCHSCREMKLKAAFLYLSECLSRHIEPKVCAYNAIIGGVFTEGLYRHAKFILEDMIERKIMPELLTYKILLAGYCKYRQFDDIEQILRTMETNGVNDVPSGNCAFSKALSFLGLDHLGVKVKRDNAAGFPKAEFFDSVGNGLYLDTDPKRFETSLVQILDNASYSDISPEIVRACQQGNVASALLVIDEAFQQGHDISPASCSELIKSLCMSPAHVMDVIDFMEEMPYTFDKLDAQTLNLAIQALSKNGMSACARLALDRLFRRGLPVNQDTYTYLLIGFCIERNILGFWEYWNVAIKSNWAPDSKDLMPLVSHLCKWGVIEEALKLMSVLLHCYPNLCGTGYTTFSRGWKHGLVIELTTLISALLSFGRNSEAKSYLNSLSRSALIISDINFDALIKELCGQGDLEMSVNLINTMLKNGRLPSEASYSSVIYRLCVLKEFDQALDFLAEMQFENLKPSEISCDVLMRGLCATGRTSDAKKILEILMTFGSAPSFGMYRTVFDNYSRCNNTLEAAKLLHDMQQAGHTPKFEMQWSVISNLSSTGRKTEGYEQPILSNLISSGEFPMKNKGRK